MAPIDLTNLVATAQRVPAVTIAWPPLTPLRQDAVSRTRLAARCVLARSFCTQTQRNSTITESRLCTEILLFEMDCCLATLPDASPHRTSLTRTSSLRTQTLRRVCSPTPHVSCMSTLHSLQPSSCQAYVKHASVSQTDTYNTRDVMPGVRKARIRLAH